MSQRIQTDKMTAYLPFVAGGRGKRTLLALASKERLVRILEKMLDETEFLSDYGIRSWEHQFSVS